MALNKDERRALELARERIASCQSSYICDALASVRWQREELKDAVTRLRKYIRDAIYPLFSLDHWQHFHAVECRSAKQERADRLDWIDWMLGKPLPGEQVEIIWFSKDTVHSAAEYCGREFYAKRWIASTIHDVFEKTESRGMVKVCEGDDFAKINAAIVAHVWPEA